MQKAQRWIIGNWKMNGTHASSQALASAVAAGCKGNPDVTEVVVCPPAVWLQAVKEALGESAVKLGAQDCHGEAGGAFTGNISAAMLKEAGCSYVIVGHSERRQHQHETSGEVRKKAEQALENGLIPIICVGETAAERKAGNALSVVEAQLKASIPARKGDFLLAYEPVWAIGSGQIPSASDIAEMHGHICKVAGDVPVLYGGSVKADNAAGILGTQGVAGLLIGGASLKAEEFCGIIAAGT